MINAVCCETETLGIDKSLRMVFSGATSLDDQNDSVYAPASDFFGDKVRLGDQRYPIHAIDTASSKSLIFDYDIDNSSLPAQSNLFSEIYDNDIESHLVDHMLDHDFDIILPPKKMYETKIRITARKKGKPIIIDSDIEF